MVAIAMAVSAMPLLMETRAEVERADRERVTMLARLAASSFPAFSGPSDASKGESLGDRLLPSSAQHEQLISDLHRLRIIGEVRSLAILDASAHTLIQVPASVDELRPVWALNWCGAKRIFDGESLASEPWRDDEGLLALAACAPLMDSGGTVIGAVVVEREITGKVGLSAEETRSALVFILGTLLASFIVMVGTRRLLAPLEEVASAARRMSAGERGLRVRVQGPLEMRQVAETLNDLGEALEEREEKAQIRLSAIAEFAGFVAHEVRNPLQSLALYVNLASTEEDAQTRRQILTSIEEEIHVLENFVQRFLRSAGPVQAQPEAGSVKDVVERALIIVGPRAEECGLRVETRIPEGMLAWFDRDLVCRALENLILNALQALGERQNPKLVIEAHSERTQLVIWVDDSGPGVPLTDRTKIFDPYLSRRPGGTGLGLSLVQQVARAHRGTIRCLESPLGGARFELRLPLSGDVPASEPSMSSPRAGGRA